MDHVLEITTFAPAPGRTAADFVAAGQDVDAYLARQPGFRGRTVAVREDGTVVDIVAWDTAGQAMAAARGITTETGGSPVHATIDQRTVDWQVARVAHTA
ncbi:hypothetical protein ACFYXS_35300 [Streptomyces sp. NPDC002574]|uniref:hypothetical protein n=1 Tax=Streptomyces sp. NPDC002574 TaxID=3364652 RepID=UPI00368F568D